MRRQILGQTGIEISRLGFGCVRLPSERREAIRILEHAFSLGITHFDVARIYGFGQAEAHLGEFLRGKRQQVTVATKFGIQPPTGMAGNPRLIELAKKILGPFPGLIRRARRRRTQMVQAGVFTPQAAVESLELSLRTLGTDSIDIFFLHEATLSDAANEPLIEALRQQVRRGKIRSFGIASLFDNLKGGAGVPAAYQVLQFNDNAVEPNLADLPNRERHGLLTHSIFQPFPFLLEAIAAEQALAGKYSAEMNVDLTDAGVIGSLLLHYALRANPDGVILFASMSPERISSNVRDAESSPYSDQQLSSFVKFGKAFLKSASGAKLKSLPKNPWKRK